MADVYWIGGSGSQSLATTTNYSTGALPSAADNLWFASGTSLIDSGLTALSAIALAAIYVVGQFAGAIGNTANTGDSLVIGAGTPKVTVDAINLTRFKIDFGTRDHTTTVINTGASADDGLETVRIRGGNTASKLYVVNGTCGIATTRPGLTATLAEFDISGGTLNMNYGTTWVDGNQTDGALLLSTGATGTFKQTGGTVKTQGTGLIAVGDIGGTATLNHRPASGAAFTTLSVQGGGSADFSQDPRAFSITNAVKLYKGSQLQAYNQAQATWTAGLDLIECGIEDVKLRLGRGLLLTVAAG